MAELAQQVRVALFEANRSEGMSAELKARLQAIDAALLPGLEETASTPAARAATA